MVLLMDQCCSVLPLRSAKAREFGELWREKCTRVPWTFPFQITRTSSFRSARTNKCKATLVYFNQSSVQLKLMLNQIWHKCKYKGQCKRTQHCWPTTRNIVGPYMFLSVCMEPQHCWHLLALVAIAYSLKQVKLWRN